MKTIVICSGGLDSVSLAHKVAAEQELFGLLSFDYGQRHRKELDFAAACARHLGVPHQIIDIREMAATSPDRRSPTTWTSRTDTMPKRR